MNVFNVIIGYFPVALVPELVLSFLGGDDCLDALDYKTMDKIFTRRYTRFFSQGTHVITFLDEECKFIHSFDDQPAVINNGLRGSSAYYKNNKLHREGGKPAIILTNGTLGYFENGKSSGRVRYPFQHSQ